MVLSGCSQDLFFSIFVAIVCVFRVFCVCVFLADVFFLVCASDGMLSLNLISDYLFLQFASETGKDIQAIKNLQQG